MNDRNGISMTVHMRRMTYGDLGQLVELSLLAWDSVDRSFQLVLGPTVYPRVYPDWRASQTADVQDICGDTEHNSVWVAELDGVIAGYVAYSLNSESAVGEVELLAVHPAYQGQGIGTQLNTLAMSNMKTSGMTLAQAATGGDPGHAPARASYEKAGYTGLPLVRYYKVLVD